MSQAAPRSRGVLLTDSGKKRLEAAIAEAQEKEKYGKRFTQAELSDRAGLSIKTIKKIRECTAPTDETSVSALFQAFGLELESSDYGLPETSVAESPKSATPKHEPRLDWVEAPHIPAFYGRTGELSILRQWAVKNHCRLIMLLGMGGIGKTSLAAKLVEQVQGEFDYVVWRSLRGKPPLENILAGLIRFLSSPKEIESNLPESVPDRIAKLLDYLNQHRCLLVLDNAESILQAGYAGYFRKGYEGYRDFLQRVSETAHQSCLVLTSREKPRELATFEGDMLPVRSLQLDGVKVVAGQAILKAKGLVLADSRDQGKQLIRRYAGNPLTLKLVAAKIQELFNGDIDQFLSEDTLIFDDIRILLDDQFYRLSVLEKQVMYWLAINREPTSIQALQEDVILTVSKAKLLDTLSSLGNRSLIETIAGKFTQQLVVMEYLTNQLIEQVCEEIQTGEIELFNTHALIKATAKDYVREMQIRLIIRPLVNRLLPIFISEERLVFQLTKILSTLQEKSPIQSSYAGGNSLNLLCYLQTDLSHRDFSNLTLWQAYLKGANLRHVNFANSNLAKSLFTQTLSSVLAVAFSPNGKYLVTGGLNGEICLWRVEDGQQLMIFQGHTDWVWSVAFSPDGQTLASGSDDGTIRLWRFSTGQCVSTLQGHAQRLRTVAFSPNSQVLASGGKDGTVKLWEVSSRQCLHSLAGHTDWVNSVAFSSSGQLLASGGDDKTVRLWDSTTGQCIETWQEHTSRIRSVAFSPNGQTLASGSEDQTVKLWDVNKKQCTYTLKGHTNWVNSVAFSADGQLVASGDDDQIVRLWKVGEEQCLKVLEGHHDRVSSVTFSRDGQILASGGYDQTVKFWEFSSGRCLNTLQGYTSRLLSLTFSPDSNRLASSNYDQMVRFWDVGSGQCLNTWQGYADKLSSMAFSLDGKMLASVGKDHKVRLWSIKTGRCLKIFHGHTGRLLSVAFSPDGQTLASGSEDQTVRLWEVSSGFCLNIFHEHTSRVRSVTFSQDGQLLASGGDDQKVRIWEVGKGKCLKILAGHTDRIKSVSFGPNSQTLASASYDRTVRCWEVKTGECLNTFTREDVDRLSVIAFSPDGLMLASGGYERLIRVWRVRTGHCAKTLKGHTDRPLSLAFSPDGKILASGSQDETIRLWDINTGECMKTLKAERPYEGMNITNITGLTEATISMMKALGSVVEKNGEEKGTSKG